MTENKASYDSPPNDIDYKGSGNKFPLPENDEEDIKRPSPYMIIIPIFFLIFATNLNLIAARGWMKDQVCRAVNNGQSPNGLPGMMTFGPKDTPLTISCGPDNKEIAVAEANWDTLLGTLTLILGTLTSPVYGVLSDYWGRRPNFLLSALSLMVVTSGLLIVINLETGLWPLVLFHALEGALGGAGTLLLTSFSYMSDTTTDATRASGFVVLQLVLIVSGAVGLLLGPILYTKMGATTFFILVIALQGIAFVFLFLLVPESLPKKLKKGTQTDKKESYAAMTKRSFSDIAFILRRMATPTLAVVFGVNLLLISVESAQIPLLFPLSAIYWKWNMQAYSTFYIKLIGAKVITMLVFAPILAYFFAGPTKTALQNLRYECNVARLSAVFLIIAQLFYAFANVPVLWNTAASFEGLAGLADPMLKSILSRSTPENDQGKLHSTVEFVKGVLTIVFKMGLTYVLTQTNTTYVAAPFLVTCGVYGLGFLLSLLIRESKLLGYIQTEESQNEPGTV